MAKHTARRKNRTRNNVIVGGIVVGAALAVVGAAPASADNKYNDFRDVGITFLDKGVPSGTVFEPNVLNDGHQFKPTIPDPTAPGGHTLFPQG